MRISGSIGRSAMRLLVIVTAGVVVLHAQGAPSCEVASIKLHDPNDPSGGNFFQGPDRWAARNYTLRQLVRTAYQLGLGGSLDRAVINRTGLAGVFDFTLQYAPPTAELGATPSADAPGPSIFTALQEQLGLELRAERAIVDVFVIESAEKPAN